MDEPLHIGHLAVIEPHELFFTYSHSGGPGGQNVNKVATRATLWFAVDASRGLTESQKAIVRQRLPTRISKEGLLHISSQKHRSQTMNKEAAIERFVELMLATLTPRPRRRPTRVPKAQKARRLESKKRRGEIKRLRRPPTD